MGYLKKKYPTPLDAGCHYNIGPRFKDAAVQTEACMCAQKDSSIQVGVKVASKCVQSDLSIPRIDTVDGCPELQQLSVQYASICQGSFELAVPNDFLVFSGAAMVHLARSGRSNVLYNLAKGFGTLRANGDSLIPMQRMPMGLIEHTANFFIAENINQV